MLWLIYLFNYLIAKEINKLDPVCGFFETIYGVIRMQDRSLNTIQELKAGSHATIPCGSWISTEKGFAKVKYYSGVHLSIAKNTFLQLLYVNDTQDSDHMKLYKGTVLVDVHDQNIPFSILTASARAKNLKGQSIIIFDDQQKISQMICLTEQATLENKFVSSHTVTVRAGEMSALNLAYARVIPEEPQAVSLTDLKEKLLLLRVPSSQEQKLLMIANQRQNRKILTSSKIKRSIASQPMREIKNKSTAPSADYFLKRYIQEDPLPFLQPTENTVRKDIKINIGVTESSKITESQKKELIKDLSEFQPELSD